MKHGYPNPWLSGKSRHRLSYALVAHTAPWAQARIPQMAWEFNCPPIAAAGVKATTPRSFVQTSTNVIVEALRREGSFIELRLAECLGAAATGKQPAQIVKPPRFSRT
jgi:hypothetical protein